MALDLRKNVKGWGKGGMLPNINGLVKVVSPIILVENPKKKKNVLLYFCILNVTEYSGNNIFPKINV